MLDYKEPASRKNRSPRQLILVVEDDAINAACIAQIISQETSYHVFLARDSFQALEVVKHLKPHLFILDYRLPAMNGIQLYDHLHAQQELKDIPALILSACLDECADALETRKLLAIEKPFNVDDFLLTIDEMLTWSSNAPVLL